ncbi:MAG: hypothetical protein V4492_05795 [Chlamydiota bacterium]
MRSFIKKYALLLLALVLFVGTVTRVDRTFFKRNSSFCIRFLFTSLPNQDHWEIETPSAENLSELDRILEQRFHYLGKGGHCYAFVSEDQNYVIKFHRYASHMRIFSWINHPFSYRFDPKRIKIKEHNLQKLDYNLKNYKNSFEQLKEETGLIFLHINRSDSLHRTARLVDKTQAEYRIPLDQVTFILQHKANLIYPTLDELYSSSRFEEGKQIISSIIQLMVSCCQKGFVDEDPILRKNYGLLGLKAIHIDVGDLIPKEGIHLSENYIPYVKEMTESLRKRLELHYPELLSHYYSEVERIK